MENKKTIMHGTVDIAIDDYNTLYQCYCIVERLFNDAHAWKHDDGQMSFYFGNAERLLFEFFPDRAEAVKQRVIAEAAANE